MERETGVRIALKEVFSNPTVETLAKLVMEALERKTKSRLRNNDKIFTKKFKA